MILAFHEYLFPKAGSQETGYKAKNREQEDRGHVIYKCKYTNAQIKAQMQIQKKTDTTSQETGYKAIERARR